MSVALFGLIYFSIKRILTARGNFEGLFLMTKLLYVYSVKLSL
jgi:hypothetical protein